MKEQERALEVAEMAETKKMAAKRAKAGPGSGPGRNCAPRHRINPNPRPYCHSLAVQATWL